MATTINGTTGINTPALLLDTPLPEAEGGTGVTESRSIVQRVNVQTGVVASGTTVFPLDNTIPQNTEGVEFMTLAITPKSVSNILVIEIVAHLTHTVGYGEVSAALFQDTTANAIAAGFSGKANTTNQVGQNSFSHTMVAGTTSSTTFKVRGGTLSGGTTTFNGGYPTAGGGNLGGVLASSITITEYTP